MISFDDISNLFARDLHNTSCIEVNFMVLDNPKFIDCWMGKMPDKRINKERYWFGLTEDGENASDYESFVEMVEARVFDSISLKEIWNQIQILSIDGCEPDWMISMYLK